MGPSMLSGMTAAGPLVDEEILAEVKALDSQHQANTECIETRQMQIKPLMPFKVLNQEYQRIRALYQRDGEIEAQIQALMQAHKEKPTQLKAERPIEEEEQQMFEFFVTWLCPSECINNASLDTASKRAPSDTTSVPLDSDSE
jgi:hypothetical protein